MHTSSNTTPTTHGARINPSLANFPSLPAEALIDVKTVAVLIGRSANTVWRMARAGTLPAPIKVGPNSTRWKVGAIRVYLASIV